MRAAAGLQPVRHPIQGRRGSVFKSGRHPPGAIYGQNPTVTLTLAEASPTLLRAVMVYSVV